MVVNQEFINLEAESDGEFSQIEGDTADEEVISNGEESRNVTSVINYQMWSRRRGVNVGCEGVQYEVALCH